MEPTAAAVEAAAAILSRLASVALALLLVDAARYVEITLVSTN